MTQKNTALKPQQVAQTFENIFIEKLDIRPSVVGLDKNVHTDIGLDSLDCMEMVMEMEKRFDIKISNEELLFHAPLRNMLNACTDNLKKTNRLSAYGVRTIKKHYVTLLKKRVQRQK